MTAGELDGFLVVALPAPALDAGTLDELVPLAFDEHAGGVDRLRAVARAVPGAVLADVALREPIGAGHPLRIAEAVARLGGRPADPRSVEEHEEQVYPLLDPAGDRQRVLPHEDPDPARRVARRILQRLNGMGKWGGYHTDFAHLARGFGGNDRAARLGGRRGAPGRRPAGREAVRRPAPRVPQPAPRGRHPPPDRHRRAPVGAEAPVRMG